MVWGFREHKAENILMEAFPFFAIRHEAKPIIFNSILCSQALSKNCMNILKQE